VVGVKQKVVGLKQLEKDLQELVKAVSPPQSAEVMYLGAQVIQQAVRDRIEAQGLIDTRNLWQSVEAYKINQYAAGVRVPVVYAAVHEYGLYQQPITGRQRRFFWYKYLETGDDMWKALALSATYTIPARPYFRPGIDDGWPEAVDVIRDELVKRLKKAVG
jgi:phage gpG-like protein